LKEKVKDNFALAIDANNDNLGIIGKGVSAGEGSVAGGDVPISQEETERLKRPLQNKIRSNSSASLNVNFESPTLAL